MRGTVGIQSIEGQSEPLRALSLRHPSCSVSMGAAIGETGGSFVGSDVADVLIAHSANC